MSVVVYERDDGDKSRTIQQDPVAKMRVTGLRGDPLNIHFTVVRFYYRGTEHIHLRDKGGGCVFCFCVSRGVLSLIVLSCFGIFWPPQGLISCIIIPGKSLDTIAPP